MVHVKEDDTYVIHGPPPLVPLSNISMGKILYDSLISNPNEHAAMVDSTSGETVSYKELLEKTCALAVALQKAGYGQDSIFTICSENNLQFFTPIIAALYIGAVFAPVNHNYTSTELEHSMGISKPKIVFTSKDYHKKYVYFKSSAKYIERVIVIDCDDEESLVGAESLTRFVERNLKGQTVLPYAFRPAQFDADDQVALIMCSSGTTGLPKGVMLTHTNIVVRYHHTTDLRYTINPVNNSVFAVLPFFHAYGLLTTLNSIAVNHKVIVLRRFDEQVFLKSIQDYRITSLWLAPPIVVFLAKSPLVGQYDLSSVVEIVSGAAPLSKETEQNVKRRLNVKIIRQGYGLTEATLAVIIMDLNEQKHGSTGKVMSYMSCKIRDPETGRSLGPKQVGELCFKGPMVMKGYYGNEEATRNCFTSDGWLLSGDLAYYDEDKYFFVVDRLKELIKYKGFQVAPAELEAVLLTNSKIKDAAVVGVPKEDVGEYPLAFVVKHPNVDLTEKEVQKYVADKVSSQKHLRGGVIFVPAIPKNPSGKILRRELRQMLNQHLKSKL